MTKMYERSPDEQIKKMTLHQVSNLIGDVVRTAQEVKDKTDRLPQPKVNSEGGTLVEKEYAEKDELAAQLQLKIATLDRVRLYLEHLRDQAYNELQVVSANETRLHHDKPKREFSEAEAQLAHQYKTITHLLKKLHKAFDVAQKVLAQAFSKRFSGGLPRKHPELEVNPFDIKQMEERKLHNALNREIKNVLETK